MHGLFLWKTKEEVSIVNTFQKKLYSSERKPNKVWVDQGSELYKSFLKKWLKDNDTEVYSIYSENKSDVAEWFIRTLINAIYEHITAVSKNVYVDVLGDIVDECNNTFHRTIKMKHIDVKSDSYAEYNENSNEKNPKFNVGNHVRISKYKNNFTCCMSNGNVMIVHLIVWLIKKTLCKNDSILSEILEETLMLKLIFSNYATKTDLNTCWHPSVTLKTNLASLKAEVDKLNFDNLVPVLVGLRKLSDVNKNDVAKKAVYNKLATKVNNIDTSEFVLKTKCGTDKSELEKKIPDTSGLVKKTDYSPKISEIEHKISSISGLATNVALTAVKNKIPEVSNLVKKTEYDTKISSKIEKKVTGRNHYKYITTADFNKFAKKVFDARLLRANLVTKADTKLTSVNKKINSNKTKHLLVENELKKLKMFDSIYFIGKRRWCSKLFIISTSAKIYKRVSGVGSGKYIYYWKSKGLSDKTLNLLLRLIPQLLHT